MADNGYQVGGFPDVCVGSVWAILFLGDYVFDEEFAPILTLDSIKPLDKSKLVVPPDWAVRCVCPRGGRRGRKYPTMWQSASNMTGSSPYGHYENGVWVANSRNVPVPWEAAHGPLADDWQEAEKKRAEARMEKRQGRKKAARFQVPLGNLPEDAYRFWIGHEWKTYLTASCRWCGRVVYNKAERDDHGKKHTKHMEMLLVVYRIARNNTAHMCAVCGHPTRSERYGVPLCATEACLRVWKFGAAGRYTPMKGLAAYTRLAHAQGALDPYKEDIGSEPGRILVH